MNLRKLDTNSSKTFNRNNRFNKDAEGKWYVSTREGYLGPYSSKEHAQKEISMYIYLHKNNNKKKSGVQILEADYISEHDRQLWENIGKDL